LPGVNFIPCEREWKPLWRLPDGSAIAARSSTLKFDITDARKPLKTRKLGILRIRKIKDETAAAITRPPRCRSRRIELM
jgi:hypothetical protein